MLEPTPIPKELEEVKQQLKEYLADLKDKPSFAIPNIDHYLLTLDGPVELLVYVTPVNKVSK